MIDFYNQELARYQQARLQGQKPVVKDFVSNDATKISWSSSLYPKITSNIEGKFNQDNVTKSLYRPFNKQCIYFDTLFNHRVSVMPKIFPEAGIDNLVIGVTGKGANSFSALISNVLPDLNFLEAGGQCFPLRLYEPIKADDEKGRQDGAFANDSAVVVATSGKQYTAKDGISGCWLETL